MVTRIHHGVPADSLGHLVIPMMHARAALTNGPVGAALVLQDYIRPLRFLAGQQWGDKIRIEALAYSTWDTPAVLLVARPAASEPLE